MKKHLIAITAAIFVIAGGSYAACTMEVLPSEGALGPAELGVDAGVPTLPPELNDPEDRRIDPAWRGSPFEPGAVTHPMPQVPAAEPTLELPEAPSLVRVERPQAPQACGASECGAHELCCWPEGVCYPADCRNCCPGEDERPGPAEIGMPVTDPAAR